MENVNGLLGDLHVKVDVLIPECGGVNLFHAAAAHDELVAGLRSRWNLQLHLSLRKQRHS